MIAFTMCIVLLSGGVVAPEAQRLRLRDPRPTASGGGGVGTGHEFLHRGGAHPPRARTSGGLRDDRFADARQGDRRDVLRLRADRHLSPLPAALPDSLHRKIREAFRVRTMYRGDTQERLGDVRYRALPRRADLAREPGDRWFNGRSSEENFRDGAEWLREWMKITTTRGQGEFDSPTYFTVFLGPMLVLQEFATDPEMKRAGMMVDLLLADFGAEHLGGNYGGGHSRDYPDDMIILRTGDDVGVALFRRTPVRTVV